MRDSDPCLCGDPECGNCFPRYCYFYDEDEDAAYERHRQWEIDNEQQDRENSPHE